MDGCPDKGENIPIRMYMKGIPLAPSYKNIHNRLSVKYWINLVLLDDEDRRYFKQTEVTIYRKPWSALHRKLSILIYSINAIALEVLNWLSLFCFKLFYLPLYVHQSRE